MGNTKSEFFDEVSVDPWWQNDAQPNTKEVQKEAIMAEISTIHEKRIKLIAEKKTRNVQFTRGSFTTETRESST